MRDSYKPNEIRVGIGLAKREKSGFEAPLIKPIKGKAVAICFKNEDEFLAGQKSSKAAQRKPKMSVAVPKVKNPRMVIKKIPARLSEKTVENFFQEEKHFSGPTRKVKHLRSENYPNKTNACVIEMTEYDQKVYEKKGYIDLSWERCPIFSHTFVAQCFNCCKFWSCY